MFLIETGSLLTQCFYFQQYLTFFFPFPVIFKQVFSIECVSVMIKIPKNAAKKNSPESKSGPDLGPRTRTCCSCRCDPGKPPRRGEKEVQKLGDHGERRTVEKGKEEFLGMAFLPSLV